SIFLDVFEKEIAERHALNLLMLRLGDECFHRCFILSISARVRQIDDVQRKADRLCLSLQQFQSHRVNRNALIELIDSRHESDDFNLALLAQNMQRPGAVLATTPAQKSFLKHYVTRSASC